MGPEGLNNQPQEKKGIKAALQKLAKVAALGAALGGAPAETKSMQLEKLPESKNVIDKRGLSMEQEDLTNIAMNPNFDISRMTQIDPVVKEVMFPPKNISPLDTKMKPPSQKKAPQSKPAPTHEKKGDWREFGF